MKQARELTVAHPPRVLLLRSDAPQQRYLESALARAGLLDAVLVESGTAQRARLWRRRRLRAWAWRTYQDARQRISGRARYAREHFAAPAVDVPRAHCDWINCADAHRYVAEVAPDVAIVCGTSYIAPSLLAAVPIAINVHGGALPEYKGNHGVFFAYARGDFARIGASLHLVAARLDGGDLLAVVRPAMRPGLHDGHLYCRAVRDAIDLLCTLLRDLAQGRPLRCAAQPEAGHTYRHRDRTPLIELATWWRRRTGRLRTPHLEPDIRLG